MDFNFEEEPQQEGVGKAPKKRFRKNKLKLIFDTDERKKFLLGFRKRKQERKEKYIEKLERNLAKEKKRIKQETKKAVKKLSSSHTVLPEVKSIIDNMPEKEETYDLGNTLVSITSLDDQIYRKLPTIKEEDEEDELEDEKPFSSSKRDWKQSLLHDESDDDDEDCVRKAVKSDPFFNPVNDDELSRSESSSEDERDIYYNPLEMLRKNTEGSETPGNEDGMSKAKLEKEANRMLQHSEAFKKMQRIKQKKSKKFRMFRLQPKDAEGAEVAGTKGGGGKTKGFLRKKGKGNKKGKKGK